MDNMKFVLEGRVKKVLFNDHDSRYFIFIMELFEQNCVVAGAPNGAITIDNKTKIATVKGTFLTGVIEKQTLRVVGDEWQEYKGKYSLRVIESKPLREDSTQFIESYLSTLGIGPKITKKIIEKFGTNTLKALIKPQELSRVQGISLERAEKIAAKSLNSTEVLSIAHALGRLGIKDFKVSTKIVEAYEEDAKNVIVNYPYKMFEDNIVSFRVADTIAMNREKKLETNDKGRIRAAFILALRDLASKGDCCINATKLIKHMEWCLVGNSSKHSMDKTPLDIGRVTEVMVKMVENKDIIHQKVGEDTWCYLPSVYFAETISAKLLKGLAAPTNDAIPNEEEFIKNLEKEFGLEYDIRQKEAICAPGRSSLCIVTGGPGTGKTTTIRGMIQYRKAQKPDCKILCLAPTGKAAQRMREATGLPASTIHRGLEAMGGVGGLSEFRRNEENPLECDTVIVDEFSMVDILLLEALLKAIPAGTKVIIVGDKDQLPSVGPGAVLQDLIASGKLPVVTLELVFRQGKTSLIAMNSKAIRNGDIESVRYDQYEFVFIKRMGADSIAKACAELFQKGMAKYKDANAVQILTPIRALNEAKPNATCCDALNPILRDIANPAMAGKEERRVGRKIFRVGDKVMQFHNNYDKDVMNGDCGYIIEIDSQFSTMKIDFGDKIVEYEKDEFDEIDLCYATTIHKSQGSEYPMVIMPLCESQGLHMLTRNLVYTGITRAKKVVFLVGEPKAFEYALAHIDNGRNTTLKERI